MVATKQENQWTLVQTVNIQSKLFDLKRLTEVNFAVCRIIGSLDEMNQLIDDSNGVNFMKIDEKTPYRQFNKILDREVRKMKDLCYKLHDRMQIMGKEEFDKLADAYFNSKQAEEDLLGKDSMEQQ